MRESVLCAYGDDCLGIWIERNAILLSIFFDNGLPEMWDAPRDRIAVVARIARRFDQLIDDRFGSCAIGIAHPHVDDIQMLRPGLGLELIDDGEDIGREFFYAIEFIGRQRHTKIVSQAG